MPKKFFLLFYIIIILLSAAAAAARGCHLLPGSSQACETTAASEFTSPAPPATAPSSVSVPETVPSQRPATEPSSIHVPETVPSQQPATEPSSVSVPETVPSQQPATEPSSVPVPETVPSQQPATETSPAPFSEMRGIWISFYDLSDITDRGEYADRIDGMFDTAASCGFNTVFFHVHPFSDALYKSELFPFSHIIGFKDENGAPVQGADPGYDPLDYAVKAAHSRGLRIHAWMNPYRVWTLSTDIEELCEDNIARIWLLDDDISNDENVLFTPKGIFFNPASEEVRDLLCAGVRELLDNYDLDGIHFDDYFYPTDDESFDRDSYEDYRECGGKLSQNDWRRKNVNILISRIYSLVKSYDGAEFGVSPAGNIDKVVNTMFADVVLWGSESGYADYLCPQIYFGFENETFPFGTLLDDWRKLVTDSRVKLYAGLPAYKLGAADANAGSGRNEFKTQKQIIARMICALREAGFDGFSVYSFAAVSDPGNSAEISAMKTAITQNDGKGS